MADPQFEQQLKLYEQAVQHFHQQKYSKAKELLEKAMTGPSKELADRAQVHLRITEQRMAKQASPSLKTVEEHRSEERRVGKECGSQKLTAQLKKKKE